MSDTKDMMSLDDLFREKLAGPAAPVVHNETREKRVVNGFGYLAVQIGDTWRWRVWQTPGGPAKALAKGEAPSRRKAVEAAWEAINAH